MKLIFVVLFINFIINIDGEPVGRIVGGKITSIEKFPYQVLLKKYGYFFCSGTILNARYVLTAAHCLTSPTIYGMTVTVGTSLRASADGDVYKVEKFIVHQEFDRYVGINDIALIRLKDDITFKERVRPVKLPNRNFNSSSGVVLSGWGSTGEQTQPSDVLMEIDLNVISNERCDQWWKSLVKESHICTLTRKGEGACNADSGGPLTDVDAVQIGIVSFGDPCAVGVPDVYTRVYSYLPWIHERVQLF